MRSSASSSHKFAQWWQRTTLRRFSTLTRRVFFEYLPKRVITETALNTVWVKCGGADKERVTTMLLGDSDGITYPLFLVFKAAPSSFLWVREENAAARHGFGRRM